MRRMNSAGRCSIRRATTRTTTPRVWPTKGRTIRSFLPLVSLHGPKRKRFFLIQEGTSYFSLLLVVSHLQENNREPLVSSSGSPRISGCSPQCFEPCFLSGENIVECFEIQNTLFLQNTKYPFPDFPHLGIFMCIEGAGAEGGVPPLLLKPVRHVHLACLVKVQLVLGYQVCSKHPWTTGIRTRCVF